MSQLTDIEQRIDQLEGGRFEKLCDAYLNFRERKSVYPLGVKSGTFKTKPGQPDSYLSLSDGTYIFIQCTTEKGTPGKFLEKARKDIGACIETAEQGIGLNNLKKIIFCHTYQNLPAEDDQALRRMCGEQGVELELIGPNQLAFDLYKNDPRLVREFLNIAIVPLVHPMPAPYSNRFKYDSDSVSLLGRDEELNALLDFCGDEGRLYWTGICGEGGMGKTRLAYELCRKMERESWSVYKPQHTRETLDAIRSQLEKGIASHMLICLDYAKTQLDEIAKLITILAEAFPVHPYKIRIIIIERDFSDLPDRTNAIANYQYRFGEGKKPYVNEEGVMELHSPKAQIPAIMRDYCGRRGSVPDDAATAHMREILQSIDPLCERPLYALCIADAWCSGENLYHWDRTDALQYIVSKEHQRWRDVILDEPLEPFKQRDYRHALDCVMLVSTLSGGVTLEEIAPLVQETFALDITGRESLDLMKRLNLLDEQGEVMQIVPDLIGEYFCIDTMKEMEESQLDAAFSTIFSAPFFFESVQYFRRLYDDYTDIILDAPWLRYIHTITYPRDVSYIRKGQFRNCGYLRAIRLHDRIQEIPESAFHGCVNLREISFPAMLEAIGISAFKGCGSLLEIELPDSTRAIGYAAFRDCTSLRRAVISREIRDLSAEVFARCGALTELDLRGAEIKIGREALKGCTRLQVIKGTERITEIAPEAFQWCGSLTALRFSSLRAIGDRAFSDCTGLQRVDMSACPLKTIPRRSFYGCEQVKTIVLPLSVEHIGYEAFRGCAQLTRLNLPGSIRHIESGAFQDCGSLASLNLQPEAQTIEAQAIANCKSLQNLPPLPAAGKPVKFCGFTFSSISRREIGFLISYWNLEEIEVPETVVEIGNRAFTGHKKMTRVRIPKSVTSVGEYAFVACSSLVEVNACGNQIQKIGAGAFRVCPALRSILGALNISTIENRTFFGCAALERISFAGRIERIGAYAFANCRNLEPPHFQQPLPEISANVFEGCEKFHQSQGLSQFNASCLRDFKLEKMGKAECDFLAGYSGLEQVCIPSTCTGFSAEAFSCNTVVRTLRIPDSVKTLPKKAFCGCANLETIELPDAIRELPDQIFMDCKSLAHIVFGDYPSNTIPGDVHIGSGAFSGCESLKEIKLSAGLKSIPEYAFSQCARLSKVDLPEGLTEIGCYAFQSCGSLQEISLPGTLTNVDDGAFKNCEALHEVRGFEHSQVSKIGNSTFKGCERLELIQLPKTLQYIGVGSFQDCKKLECLELPPIVDTIETAAFQNCYCLAEVVIPPRVSKIRPYTFKNCSSLEHIVFLGSIYAIEEGAFYHCNQLQKFNFPEGIEILGKNIWTHCHHLTEIDIPSSVRSLSQAKGLLKACHSLKKVRIPPHITEIPGNFFRDCTALEDVEIPDGLRTIGPSAFGNCGLSHLELPESLENIQQSAFRNCKNLTEISLPRLISLIPPAAFEGCTALKKVSFHSICNVGAHVFRRCADLTDIPIERISKLIGREAFKGCKSLKNVSFSDTITTICPGAFQDCSAVEEIVIPGSVEKICDSAFRGDTALKSVRIPGSVGSIEESAFQDCIQLKKVTIDSDHITIYSRAFEGCRALYLIDAPAGGRMELRQDAFLDCPAEKYMDGNTWQRLSPSEEKA